MNDLRTYLSETAQRELDSLRAALDMRLMALERALAQPDPTESLESLIIDLARVATDEAHASAANKWLEAQVTASARTARAGDVGSGIHGALMEEAAALRREVQELRTRLERETERGQALHRDAEAAQTALREERAAGARVDAELGRTRTTNVDLAEAVETLRGDLDGARKKLADLITQAHSAGTRDESARAAMASLHAQYAELQRTVEAERAERREQMRAADARIAEEVARAEAAEAGLADERERAAALDQSLRADLSAEAEKARAAQADLAAVAAKLRAAEANSSALADKLTMAEVAGAAETEKLRAAEMAFAAEAEKVHSAQTALAAETEKVQAAQAELSALAERLRAAEADLSAGAGSARTAEAEATAATEKLRAAEAALAVEAEKSRAVQSELSAAAEKARAAEAESETLRAAHARDKNVFDAARQEAAAALAQATARVHDLELQLFRREQSSAESADLDLASLLEDRLPSGDRPIRRFSRYSFRSRMAAEVDGQSAQLVDLSVGGAQVLSEIPLELYSETSVSLVSDEIRVSGRAKVMWTRADPHSKGRALRYRAGIQFTDVDPGAVEAFIIRYSST